MVIRPVAGCAGAIVAILTFVSFPERAPAQGSGASAPSSVTARRLIGPAQTLCNVGSYVVWLG